MQNGSQKQKFRNRECVCVAVSFASFMQVMWRIATLCFKGAACDINTQRLKWVLHSKRKI